MMSFVTTELFLPWPASQGATTQEWKESTDLLPSATQSPLPPGQQDARPETAEARPGSRFLIVLLRALSAWNV